MSDVYNAIEIGFEWAQDIDLSEGMIDPGDTLRAEFRYLAEDPEPIFAIASGDGIDVENNLVSLVVNADRTAMLDAPAKPGWGFVFTELVKTPESGPEAPLGFLLRIPFVLPITRAAA
jgi:hypothetical protein